MIFKDSYKDVAVDNIYRNTATYARIACCFAVHMVPEFREKKKHVLPISLED